MSILNDFQKKCEQDLLSVLSKMGLSFENKFIRGEKEKYIEGTIGDIRIWIYLDGAQIKGKKIDFRFEKADYDYKEALIQDFIAKVLELANKKPKES